MWQIINKYISTYIGIILLGIGEILFAKISLNKKIEVSKVKSFLILLLTGLACTIFYINTSGTIKTLLVYIVHVFEFKNLFKISYSKSMLLTFLYMIMLIFIEIIQLLTITNIIGVSKISYYNSFAGSLYANITTGILLVVITFGLRKLIHKVTTAKLETNTKIIVFSILIFLCSTMFLYTLIKEFRFSDDILLYLMSIAVLLIVLFSLIRQTIDNKKLMEEYDKLLDFMTTYENEIENQRILRHEIKNEFRTIRAKICDNQKNKEIIEYIDEIVNDKYEVKQEKYAKFGYLPPNGIKGLCYFKIQEAENKGITASLNISKRIKESSIYKLNVKQQRDFGRMLGVFLDNAIEASLESTDKKLGLEAYTNTKKEFKLIISNTYNNKIDKNKIGKESFSTKGKTRGHGLLLVKQLIGNNQIFEIKTDIQENLYIQTIIVKEIIEE